MSGSNLSKHKIYYEDLEGRPWGAKSEQHVWLELMMTCMTKLQNLASNLKSRSKQC